MSTNDDPASRRGRRAPQGEPDWNAHNRRPGDRWDQPSSGNRENAGSYSGRDNQPANAAYSGFQRPSYSQQQRPEPAPPPRPYEPPQTPQTYYQEPVQRQEPPRSYNEPVLPSYIPPPPPPTQPSYRQEPQLPSFGDGAGRDDLFGRDTSSFGYEQNPFGSQSGYQPASFDPAARAPLSEPAPQDFYRQPQQPSGEYDRGFGAAPPPAENPAPRFYLGDDQPAAAPQWTPQSYTPAPPQPPLDRGYAPSQGYQAGGYDPQPQNFNSGQFDPRYGGQEAWQGEEQGYHEGAAGVPALHADEFDEDFFGDEDEFEDDHQGGRRGRKMLILAGVAAALAAGGGFYAYRTMIGGGGEKATPFIRADNRPSKETPGNPGGRQFPNGEKAIYERLTPDGQTQVASFAPPVATPIIAAQGVNSNGGSSLDDRIEEALRRAQHSGDAPPPPAAPRPGADQPTVVRSEIYRPDGTRVDSRPVIQPQFANVNQGQLPPPFGNAAPTLPVVPPPAPPPAIAPFRAAAVTPQQSSAPALAAATPRAAVPAAGGFYVSLKSAPDEKAIQRDLPVLTDKYKSVLGDVQIISKIADLGARGVTYRAVAGPLGTRQEAMELCQKIKGVGGEKACFVTN